MCEAYVNAMLLKPGVDSEVTKHLASASEPSAKPTSQLCLLIKSETSYDTCRSGGGGTVPLCWSYHAQRWMKSVPNPEAAQGRLKPKSKGLFFSFFRRRRSHILFSLCSLPCCCCCCWAEQGAENCLARTLQHLTIRAALAITSTLTQWVEQYRGQW